MSVLHTKFFENLPGHCKGKLRPFSSQLKMADGSKVNPLGTVKVPLTIDNQIFYHEVLVAEIDIPLVLGYDFMTVNKCIIDIPNQALILNEKNINCVLESDLPRVFKISVDKRVVIPPRSEMIIYGKPLETIPVGTNVLIESTSSKLKNKGILVAKSLCIASQEKLPIRVMNITDDPQVIYKNTCASMAESILPQDIFSTEENPVNPEEFPDYLNVIIERCKDNLSEDQFDRVKNLLLKNTKAFAKSKNDLDHTNIIQHKINTGDALQVKQNPRRIPLLQRKEVEE